MISQIIVSGRWTEMFLPFVFGGTFFFFSEGWGNKVSLCLNPNTTSNVYFAVCMSSMYSQQGPSSKATEVTILMRQMSLSTIMENSTKPGLKLRICFRNRNSHFRGLEQNQGPLYFFPSFITRNRELQESEFLELEFCKQEWESHETWTSFKSNLPSAAWIPFLAFLPKFIW